uniref:RPC4 polymerase n=1 Tax=Anas platyrhynchos TaxID=8839 RepID=A0A8B9SIP1_ANAPL
MAEGSSGDAGAAGSLRPGLPGARGLLGRRPAPPLSPGRLPSIRSRDLTLGGVKKKTFTPNIISRKIKEEPREDVTVKKEKKERERDRQRDGHGRGRGRPEVIQSHSIFEQGPAEMMKKKAGSWDKALDVSDFGPSHIINIKKEKRETDEETKQILRRLQKDDFLDDPGLKNDIRNKPVQLPLAHSGWLFKEDAAEEQEEDAQPWLPKEEKTEPDPPLKGAWGSRGRTGGVPWAQACRDGDAAPLLAPTLLLSPHGSEGRAVRRGPPGCHQTRTGPPRFPAGHPGGRAAAEAEPGGRGRAAVPTAARHAARPAAHPGHQTHQDGAADRGRAGGGGEAGEEPGGEAGGEHVHPGRPPRGAGGEAAGPQVGEGAAGAGQGDLGRDHGDPLLLPAGAGVGRHRGQPHGRDDRPGPHQAQAGLLPGLRGPAGAPPPVAPWQGGGDEPKVPPPCLQCPPGGLWRGVFSSRIRPRCCAPCKGAAAGMGGAALRPHKKRVCGVGDLGSLLPGLCVRPGGGGMLVFGEKCNKNGFPPVGGSLVWSPPTSAPSSPCATAPCPL